MLGLWAAACHKKFSINPTLRKGWNWLEMVTIHLNPFNLPIPCTCSIPYHKNPQRIWWNEMFFRSWMLYPFSYLSSCTLCLRSKLQEKIEWQKFVSCTSRPHVMCGPLAVKVATCSLLPGHHHLSCLNLAILSIANNSRELTIASFHSVEDWP